MLRATIACLANTYLPISGALASDAADALSLPGLPRWRLCQTALGNDSVTDAIALAKEVLPGRTVEIVVYQDFCGCRIAIPGRESCFHCATHKSAAIAVVMTVMASVAEEQERAYHG